VVATGTTKEQPAKLSKTEMGLAALLMVGGVVLIAILLSAFIGRTNDWSLKSKESTETTEATEAAGEKTMTSTEYSDSVVIAGLGLGALLILTGAFYGRIREITLPGGSVLKLGDPPADAVVAAQEKATKVAKEHENVSESDLKQETESLVPQLYTLDVLQGAPKTYNTPQEYSEDLAQRAVAAAVVLIRSAGP